MPAIVAFFGRLYLVVLIVCAFAWMFSPALGREIAKRGGNSFLLFTIATMLLPVPGEGVLVASARVVLVFILLLAAFFSLFDAQMGLAFMRPIFVAGGLLLLICIGLLEGRILAAILIFAGMGIYMCRKSR